MNFVQSCCVMALFLSAAQTCAADNVKKLIYEGVAITGCSASGRTKVINQVAADPDRYVAAIPLDASVYKFPACEGSDNELACMAAKVQSVPFLVPAHYGDAGLGSARHWHFVQEQESWAPRGPISLVKAATVSMWQGLRILPLS